MNKFLHFLAKDFSQVYPLLSGQLRLRSFGIFVLMVMQSLLELFFILALTDMGIALTNPEGVRTSVLYSCLFYTVPTLKEFAADPKQLLLLVGIVVVLINACKNIVNFFTARSVAYLGEDMSLSIGQEIMSRYLYQSYAWHLSPESAQMYQRMVWRSRLGEMLTQILTLYATLLTVIILFLSLVGAEPVLTTLVIAFTSCVGIMLFRGIRHRVDKNSEKSRESAQEETTALLCATKGIREVLIYRQQETFLRALVKAAMKGRTPRTFSSIAPTLPTWVLETVGFAVVIFAVAFLIYYEQANIPRISAALGLLVLTAWRVLPYCNRAVSLQISIRNLRPMAQSVIELLEQLRACPRSAIPTVAKDFTFHKSIQLNNISFCYAGAQNSSLENINITIHKGEKIGLIGASGGGKTTLAGVLSGLLPPSGGEILVDDKELTESRRLALAEQIGYVPQSPFLFAGTLAENVAFSDWGKKWDEQKVVAACKQANVDFIDYHAEGLLRPIGENSAGLSGGQAQRISIARAMYTKPSLLIFDEATSALDQHNEQTIQNTIENLAGQVTCIIIAHRLSTVQNCDRIIWLDKGKVVMDDKAKDVLEAFMTQKNKDVLYNDEFR